MGPFLAREHGLPALWASPYWPRSRYLELAPKYWAATRARVDQRELELPLGHVTVPPPAER